MRTFRLVVGAAVLASVSPAQTVWSMGSPWTDLAAVIAQAVPGDIVLLNGLTFPPFTLTKGLTILGPGAIRPALSSVGNQLTTLMVPAAQRTHVVGVDFLEFVGVTHGVSATGTVTFEDCIFGAGEGNSLQVAGTILMHRCTFTPTVSTGTPAGGMLVQSGVCWITNSTLVGGNASVNPSQLTPVLPTTALSVVSGAVCVSGSTLRGGNGTWWYQPVAGTWALRVWGGSVSITDCTLVGGSSPTGTGFAGAAALMTNVTVSHARSTFTGGAGTPAGQPWWGSVQHVPELVGMGIAQPFRLGLSTQSVATAGSAQPLGMVAALDLVPATHPIVHGTFLGASPLIPLLVALPLPGAQVVHTLSVPNQPTLLGTAVYSQAFQLSGQPSGPLLLVSPAVGGVVH
ncbi:MAG TPA: hypothetical protein VF384_00615 [Planctomycetota bacterium]